MILKAIFGVIGAALLLAYMAPVVWRLQEPSLWTVTLIGAGMMLVDFWQSLRSKED